MPLYEGSHEAALPGAPADAFEVMTDYEGLPRWQRSLKRCRVLTRRDDGLGEEVEYEVDVKVRTVTYVLRHDYSPPNRIGSEYLRGDFRHFEGHWRFDPHGDRTRVALSVKIDPGLPVPGPLARMINNRVLKGSVEDLRRRLERGRR